MHGAKAMTEREDRSPLAVVPPEMMHVTAVKDIAMGKLNTMRMMRMGVECIWEAKAHKLRREFKNLAFKDGESIEDFTLCLSGLITYLQLLDDTIDNKHNVKKFLWVVPPRYAQVVISIEMLVDLSTLSIEELTGQLLTIEECLIEGGEGGTHLLLTEVEWQARQGCGEGSSARKTTRIGQRKAPEQVI